MANDSGLEFGPFPQRPASFKRRTTGTVQDLVITDPELQFIKNNRLVEGFYNFSSRLLTNRGGVTASNITLALKMPQVDPADAAINLTLARSNQSQNGDIANSTWSGDGDATATVPLTTQNDIFTIILFGVVFIPGPTDLLLTWQPDAADPGGVNMLAGSIWQAELVR